MDRIEILDNGICINLDSLANILSSAIYHANDMNNAQVAEMGLKELSSYLPEFLTSEIVLKSKGIFTLKTDDNI